MEDLSYHFSPSSVAIVGASEKGLWTSGFMANIESKQSKLISNCYLVNPNRKQVFGKRCYENLSSLPERVDQVVALVNASLLLGVVKDCVEVGIKSIVAVTSGLENGTDESISVNEELARLCAQNGIVLQGPNCFGYNNYNGAIVSRYGVNHEALGGEIGIIAHSGQVGAAIADSASARNLKIGYLVSSGNELVVDTNDYIEFFLNTGIKAIGCFLEQIPEPSRFARLANRALEMRVPIVVLAMGKTEAARKIAVAHTGAIAGGDAVTEAFLRRCGCVRVTSPEELIETVGVLAVQGIPEGRRVFFCGFSGGAAELFVEEADGTLLEFDEPGDGTVSRVVSATGLPAKSIHNPLDMTLDGARNFAALVDALAEDPNVDILVAQNQPLRGGIVDTRREIRESRESAFSSALVRHGAFGLLHETGDCQPGIGTFGHAQADRVHYVYGKIGISAISNAVRYGEFVARHQNSVDRCYDQEQARISPDLNGLSGVLSEFQAKDVLAKSGVVVSRDLVARSIGEVSSQFGKLRTPVVMKVLSADIPHKSDVGGVVLGISSVEEAAKAFDSIMKSSREAHPDARIDGVLLSEQLTKGFEAFVGVTTDRRLGPAVVVGMGGVYVEVFGDTSVRMAPVSRTDALDMIRELKCWPLLNGVRGGARLDFESLADIVVKVSVFAWKNRERISEVDLNPVFVYPKKEGAIAVDAVISLI